MMNSIYTLSTEYLRSDRTIETVLVEQKSVRTILWIYNFEGLHFRVFEKLLDVHHFLNNSLEAQFSFNSEEELDAFLLNIGSMPKM